MFHVITGGSGSGKSAFAEDCMMKFHKDTPLFYIATMMPFGAEMEKKIERHQKMRAGKGFHTIECFFDLKSDTVSKKSYILLECMSNLVANEWFRCVSEQPDTCFEKKTIDSLVEKIWAGVEDLLEVSENLIVVTNEVFSEGEENTIEMECYKQILASVNRKMAVAADQVTEVVYGIPVKIK